MSARLVAAGRGQTASTTAQAADWPLHNLDLRNSRFAALTAINSSNAGQLALKWSFDLPPKTVVGSSTPLVIDGVMYFNSGSVIFAVDAATGTMLVKMSAVPSFAQNPASFG